MIGCHDRFDNAYSLAMQNLETACGNCISRLCCKSERKLYDEKRINIKRKINFITFDTCYSLLNQEIIKIKFPLSMCVPTIR